MPKTVILGVIGSDAHVVGITILEQALTAAGFTVHNLGAQTPKRAFVEAAATHDADAVLVSSLYGHAERDCHGLHEDLADAGVSPVTYIGGNLVVGQEDDAVTRERFSALGFDRVFGPDTNAHEVIASLQRDLCVTISDAERVQVNS